MSMFDTGKKTLFFFYFLQYDDVDVDVTYFGQMNLDPILGIMERQ